MKPTMRQLVKLIGKPVHVDWLDAINVGTWSKVEDLLADDLHAEAVGTLSAASEDRIVVSAGRGFGDHCGNVVIPRVCVVGIKLLR